MRNSLFLGFLLLVFVPFISYGQQDWKGEYTKIGLKAGVNHFNIDTENLPVSSKTSWMVGFTTRSSFYESIQLIYGLSFYDLNTTITGREKLDEPSPAEEIRFNMVAVQASLLGSVKILDHYLSVEAGPVLQVNGKFDPQQNKEYYYIEEYSFQALDLAEINTFNINLAVGLSGGFERFKFWAQYQLGINNMLNKLNNQGLSEIDLTATNFQGNMRILSGGIIFFL